MSTDLHIDRDLYAPQPMLESSVTRQDLGEDSLEIPEGGDSFESHHCRSFLMWRGMGISVFHRAGDMSQWRCRCIWSVSILSLEMKIIFSWEDIWTRRIWLPCRYLPCWKDSSQNRQTFSTLECVGHTRKKIWIQLNGQICYLLWWNKFRLVYIDYKA